MNKERIGRYLKELRQNKKRRKDGKSFTQSDIADAFSEEGVYISSNAVKDWELGKALPSIDNLTILSKIYDRTIDELLDGEDRINVDYKSVYFIYNNDWMHKAETNDLYSMNQKQIILINSRFKELIKLRIEREFSTNEEEEFKFLFENFYYLTDYAIDFCKINTNNDYCKLKSIIYQLLEIDIRNMNLEEKYWELRKLYTEKESIRFCFQYDVDSLIDGRNEYKVKRFELLDDWQKDMYLAMYQNIEPYDDEPDRYGAHNLKIYEKMYGCEYNREFILKEGMKELIKRGACYNSYFLNIRQKNVDKKRIIDRLEELYNLCLKPIEIQVQNNETNQWDTVKIENTMKNRFINNYYFTLSSFLGHKMVVTTYEDLEETYNFFKNTEEITDDIRKEIAKNQGIDVDREYKYWFADYKLQYIDQEEACFYENKKKEKEIANGLLEIERLKKLLQEGIHYYTIESYETIGGKDEKSIRDYIEFWKSQIDYSEYLHNRDLKKTESLLKDLDNLTFNEIREKYFKEVLINE